MSRTKNPSKRPPVDVRLRAAGLRPVQFWIDEKEYEKIERAAKIDGRKVAQFLRRYALEAALAIILQKNGKCT